MRDIIYSFLGTTLDGHGQHTDRWAYWRPTISLALQEGLSVEDGTGLLG